MFSIIIRFLIHREHHLEILFRYTSLPYIAKQITDLMIKLIIKDFIIYKFLINHLFLSPTVFLQSRCRFQFVFCVFKEKIKIHQS